MLDILSNKYLSTGFRLPGQPAPYAYNETLIKLYTYTCCIKIDLKWIIIGSV